MHRDFDEALDLMEHTFLVFENAIPNKPQRIKLSFGETYRFAEKNIYQAIIQKLARSQSAVRAAKVLLVNGFVQEQNILHRIIDETTQDITFLVLAVTNDDMTDLHKNFLDAFWREEIDESGDISKSEQKRPMIPRRRIRAYLARSCDAGFGESTVINGIKTIDKMNSGFVHGASPQIMDMYGGSPPHFHISGMLHTPRIKEGERALWHYLYRSFLPYIMVAKALGLEKEVDKLNQQSSILEKRI